ncbi:hypothetical protein [Vibrio sp. M260112]|uniref:hypothetical protein n=1 Tax=Vibrio sp. M260112 TaxID=3020895 RepID=UPI002F4172DB
MKYFALRLFGDVALKRHNQTFEPEVTPLGEFDSLESAVEQAGGYIVMDAQELTAV